MGKPKKLRIIFKQAKMGKPHQMYALAMRYYEGCGLEEDMEQLSYRKTVESYLQVTTELQETELTALI